jgi:hypothetical protein
MRGWICNGCNEFAWLQAILGVADIHVSHVFEGMRMYGADIHV